MDETQDLLIRLAANLKEEDLLDNPELEEKIRQLIDNVDNSEELSPEVVSQLQQIKDKGQRFLEAMQLLRVNPESGVIQKLVEAMQAAGLLNQGQIINPESNQEPEQDEAVPAEENDDFYDQMSQLGQAHEDVPVSEKEAIEADSHERASE